MSSDFTAQVTFLHVADLARSASAAGHEVDGPHHDERFEIHHCFVRDPDGHLVEVQRFDTPL